MGRKGFRYETMYEEGSGIPPQFVTYEVNIEKEKQALKLLEESWREIKRRLVTEEAKKVEQKKVEQEAVEAVQFSRDSK